MDLSFQNFHFWVEPLQIKFNMEIILPQQYRSLTAGDFKRIADS